MSAGALGATQYRKKDGAIANFKQCGACALTGLVFDGAGDLGPCQDCEATGWIEWADGSPEPLTAATTEQAT